MPGDSTERAIVRVVAAAQFINVLEFVVVMPLGPDFAAALSIPTNRLSYVASSYTLAAALAGFAGAFLLDRFDRRKALLVALSGLVLSTASAGLAHSLPTLLAARAMAGLFGGPATSLSMSIVADAVPRERRGRSLSIVLLAPSLATTFGVPAALELASRVNWRAPFFVIAALGTIAVYLTTRLPPQRAHLDRAVHEPVVGALVRIVSQTKVMLSYAMTFAVQVSGFLIIPSLSPYLQRNLLFPRGGLGLLYLAGGMASLTSTRVAGKLVDRYGSLRVGALALAISTGVVVVLFAHEPRRLWVAPLFVVFMLALALRNVSYNTLTSKVPATQDRARFQSLQSTIGMLGMSLGAAYGGELLSTAPSGALVGMPAVAWLSMAIALSIPLFMWQVERRVNEVRA